MVSAWLDVFAASCGMHPAKKARIEMLPCLFYVMPQKHPARVLRLACTSPFSHLHAFVHMSAM
jgi:hypothetical protein